MENKILLSMWIEPWHTGSFNNENKLLNESLKNAEVFKHSNTLISLFFISLNIITARNQEPGNSKVLIFVM